MENKVILITGASSGIGKTIGLYLKEKGCTVYGTTRNLDSYKNFSDFTLLQLNVHDVKSIELATTELLKTESRIDVLINNAGVGITGPIEETPHEEILKTFETNFHGPLHMMKAVLPQMRKQKNGLIINITSIAGHMGLPYRGIYSATKGALELVTEAMRMETKDFGVKITNLAPGDYATNIASNRYHSPVLDNSAYKKPYGNTLQMINTGVKEGEKPMPVAKAVYNIMNTSEPRIHYKVGTFMQKFSVVLKHILPDKVYEKLLLNHYKL